MRDVALAVGATVFFAALLWWGLRSGVMPLTVVGAIERSKHPTLYKLAGALLAVWVILCVICTAIAIYRL